MDILGAARASPSHATPLLARRFREERRLGSKERPVVAEAVYGVIRHERLLDRAGAGDDDARVDGLADLLSGDRLAGLEAGDPRTDYADALSLPERLAGEWLDRLGPLEAARLGAALAGRAPLTVRANRARTDRARLAARLEAEGLRVEPCAGAPDGLRLLDRVNAPSLAAFQEGLFEVQDEASQRLCEAALDALARAGLPTRALDLCAGSGGKTLALAARGVRVRAHDVRSRALDELWTRARRAGLDALIRLGEPRPAPLVLVDAPCSGTGRLRRDPALRWGLRPPDLDLQRQLLHQGAALVEPGGLLLYATCSLQRAENDHEPGPGWTCEERVELWPHREGTDGFAWSLWRRT